VGSSEGEEEIEPPVGLTVGKKRARGRARVEIEYETELEPQTKIKAI